MGLSDIVKPLTGNKRTFILMRVSGLDTNLAMGLVGVSRGTYNSWFKNDTFNAIYSQVPDLIVDHRDEAVQLLRRSNQLEAVLLEGKMIRRIKEEIDSGQLVFTKTHLAREVYSKLMTDLDKNPGDIKVLNWQQRAYILTQPDQLEGGTVDGEFEEVGEQQAEHTQSLPTQTSEQGNSET